MRCHRPALVWRTKRIQQPVYYARFRSRSHDAVIRVYNTAGNVIETHEHAGEFKKYGVRLPELYEHIKNGRHDSPRGGGKEKGSAPLCTERSQGS